MFACCKTCKNVTTPCPVVGSDFAASSVARLVKEVPITGVVSALEIQSTSRAILTATTGRKIDTKEKKSERQYNDRLLVVTCMLLW